MAEILQKGFKNVKRLRKCLSVGKIRSPPIFKKRQRPGRNYQLVLFLNIVSEIFEKCIYKSLYDHSANFLTKRQHGFAKQNSAATIMLVFLKQILDALDKESSSDIIAFYTDFSKAVDRVPHLELLKKLSQSALGAATLR